MKVSFVYLKHRESRNGWQQLGVFDDTVDGSGSIGVQI
jgi:hypothetical protein